MEEILKKILYTGVGFFSLTASKIKEIVDELVNERKITEEEGKRLIDDFLEKTKQQRSDFEEQVRSVSAKFNKGSDSSDQTDVESLKKRIKELEGQLNKSSSSSSSDLQPDQDSSGRLTMEEDRLQEAKREAVSQAGNAAKHEQKPASSKQDSEAINKVENNKRVSFADDVLTPEKKLEAEKRRMQSDRPSAGRNEEDTQKTSLGGPVLTPDKKMDQARKEAED